MRISVFEAGQAYFRKPPDGALTRLACAHASVLQADLHVLQGRSPGQQRLGLKHIARISIDAARQRSPEGFDGSAGRCDPPGLYIEKSGYPATCQAYNGDELT